MPRDATFAPETPDFGGEEDDNYGYDGGGDDDYPEVPEPPDLSGMSGDEMKQAVIGWIRADPSRKSEIMNMLPELTKEIM